MYNLHYEKFQDGSIKCIENEKPFDVPDGWEWVHLPNISTSGLGKTLNKSTDTGTLLPYLCSINISWSGIDLSNVKRAKFSDAEKNMYKLQNGDLLICEGGDVGRSAIWNNNIEMYYQNALHRVRFFNDVSTLFYLRIFEYYKLNGTLDKYSNGVTIKHFVQSSLYSLYLPLPPLSEQQRIADCIEGYNAIIDTLETDIDSIKDTITIAKSKILDLAICGKLFPQDPNDEPASVLLERIKSEKEALIKQGKIKRDKKGSVIFKGDDNSYYEKIGENLPQGWTVTNLETLLSYEQPTQYIVKSTDYKNSYETPVLTAGKSFVLGYTNETDNIFSNLPTIIFDDFTTESKYVDFPFKVKSSAMKILHINTELVLPKYAYYLMQTVDIDNENHQRYWISIFSQAEVALPPLAEQQRILNALEYYIDIMNSMFD